MAQQRPSRADAWACSSGRQRACCTRSMACLAASTAAAGCCCLSRLTAWRIWAWIRVGVPTVYRLQSSACAYDSISQQTCSWCT